MTKRKMTYLGVVILLTFGGIFTWNLTARAAYESAEYTVVESEGPFEIRDYPDLKLVSTEMRFESQGSDGSFMRLFRYISGGNQAEQGESDAETGGVLHHVESCSAAFPGHQCADDGPDQSAREYDHICPSLRFSGFRAAISFIFARTAQSAPKP